MSNHNNPGNVVETFAPPILDDEVNRYKNKTATDIILPGALASILKWGCRKKPEQTFKKFLMEKHPGDGWIKYSKRWTESDLKKLDKTDCSKLDTTIMFSLIPEVCDKSAFAELEKILREAKEIRNKDSHSPDAAAISPTTLTEVRDIALQILKQGAETFNIVDDILETEIEVINKLEDQINEKAKTEKEKRLDELKEQICTEGRRETEEKVIEQEIDKLPFSDVNVFRRDVFHPCKLLVELEIKDVDEDEELEEVRQEFSPHVLMCEELLTFRSDEDVIISGLPGSGKSTFLKRLREDFVLKNPEIFHGLQNYDLLLYLECRDSIQTISQLLKNNFPKTFKNISDEDVAMEVLAKTKMLICVDGIDESNENSSILLNRLIDQFGLHGRSSFIFTSRPGSMDVLCQELTDKNRPYFTVSIQPVDEELEQIAFLDRFQAKVSEINAPELIETFTGLDQFCKECLVQPVYLSLFCHLYTLSPQAVKEWTNELDVMKHILRISEKSVRERLALEQVEGEENKILSSKLLAEICNLTVLLLLEDKLVIDQKTYAKLCGNLFAARNVSYHKILSCILVSESDETSFSYLHKSHAEFLAANAILTRLTNESGALFMASVVRIARDYTASLQQNNSGSVTSDSLSCSSSDSATVSCEDFAHGTATLFSNVFRFIILILVERGKRGDNEVIQRIFHETGPLLIREKTPLSYFIELTLSCRSSKTAIEASAEAAKRVRYSVSSARHMLGATLMLRHHQPDVLTVSRARSQEPIPELEELMKTVAEHHAGRLRLVLPFSYYESSCDDNILELMTTSQVQLTQFQGCLISNAAVQGLAASLSRATQKKKKGSKDALVFIRLAEPRQHHLAELKRVKHCLEVRASALDEPCLPRPLPLGAVTPPALTVICTSDTSSQATATLIQDLAPKEQRYSTLLLQRWHGTDDALDQLLVDLAAAGIQTQKASSPSWSSLTDSRTPWSVTSRQTLTGVTAALQHSQPRMLDVTLPRAAGTPVTLLPLMLATAERHKGLLKLNLQHSYIDCFPADDYVKILGSARCKLLNFHGCLEGGSSQLALVALAAKVTQKDKEAQLYLTLTNPRQHQLAKLATAHHVLDVRARPAPGDRCPCPLPRGPIRSPALTVVCVEATNEQEVLELIKDLAPENKRFHRLGLRQWQGSTAMTLRQTIVGSLVATGILTLDRANVPELNFVEQTMSGLCELCDERHGTQEEGLCLLFELPEPWLAIQDFEMKTVTQLLPSHQPPLLTIAPRRSDGWLEELTPLLEALPRWHTGHLRLFLTHSFWDWSPADHVVVPISLSSCQITMLAACLDTQRSHETLITSLKSVAEEEVALFISLTNPRQHQLAGLKRVDHRLVVRALHDVADSHRADRPLPMGGHRPPSLTVVCTSTDGLAGVAELMEDLAPEDKRYRGLALELKLQPTAQELEDLLTVLVAAGVHTDSTSGMPRWTAADRTDEARCQVCDERVHEEGRSCVRLWLPLPNSSNKQGGEDRDNKDDFMELQSILFYQDFNPATFLASM